MSKFQKDLVVVGFFILSYSALLIMMSYMIIIDK